MKTSLRRRSNLRRTTAAAIDIAVVGHGCLDLASLTSMEDLPAPNTLRVVSNFRLALGGPALAAAVALARLKTAPHFYGCLGDDEIALTIALLMGRCGVAMDGITRSSGRSSATMIVPRRKGRSFLHAPGHNLRLTPEQVKKGAFKNARAVLIAGIGLLPGLHGPALAKLVHQAKDENPRIIVVTDTVHPGSGISAKQAIGYVQPALPFIDVFCTSASEGSLFSGRKDPVQMARRLRAIGATRSIVIKRGADGVSYLQEGEGEVVSLPAFPIRGEKDGTGAGDGFCAALTAALVNKFAFQQAVRLASVAGAKIAETGFGTTGIPGLSELRRLARDYPAPAAAV